MKIHLLLSLLIIGLFTISHAQTSQVYDVVQQMPQYPGGEDSMWKFIRARITYPDSAVAHNIEGKLFMGFVINEDGAISDIKIKRGLSSDIDSEGVRIVKLLPHFTPGLQDGKAVKVNFTLPLTFKLKPNPIDSAPKVFQIVECMPEYPGGDKLMMDFIQKNIKYPEYERENDIQGRVVVGFVVNEDGSLSNIKVKLPVSPGIDEEAIRIVKSFPKFNPGEQRGKPVRVQFNLPIAFKLAARDVLGNTAWVNSIKNDPDLPPPVAWEYVSEKLDVKPKFSDSIGINTFLARNLKYPLDASNSGIDGTVVIGFIVNEDGHLSDFAFVHKEYQSLNKEAMRVVKLFPSFKPGMKDGKPVKALYKIPVRFTINDTSPHKSPPQTIKIDIR